MKLSKEANKLAEALMSKDHYQTALWAEENIRQVRASRTQSNPQFNLLIVHHEENIRRTFKYIINGYVEAYNIDGSLIDEEDKDEIIEFIRSMINRRLQHITNSVVGRDFYHPHTGEKLPQLESQLAGRFDRLVGEAAVELDHVRKRMVMEWKQREKIEKLKTNNQINIYGNNSGPIQQGGQNNTQTVTVNAEFEAKINELVTLVENSNLNQIQRLKASNDIKTIQGLARLEATPEVIEEAKSRLDSVTSVISLSADLVSLGIPIIQIIRAFFGI